MQLGIQKWNVFCNFSIKIATDLDPGMLKDKKMHSILCLLQIYTVITFIRFEVYSEDCNDNVALIR